MVSVCTRAIIISLGDTWANLEISKYWCEFINERINLTNWNLFGVIFKHIYNIYNTYPQKANNMIFDAICWFWQY